MTGQKSIAHKKEERAILSLDLSSYEFEPEIILMGDMDILCDPNDLCWALTGYDPMWPDDDCEPDYEPTFSIPK